MASSEQDLGHDGDPEMFGRFWTYEELQKVERKKGPKQKPDWVKDGQKPAHYPDDTEVEKGPWVYWLPDGWGQGVKITSGGKSLKCYVAPPPEGKRFFHKADIIKYCTKNGLELPKEELSQAELEEEKSVRHAIPHWPDKNPAYHLPLDWRIGYRKLPNNLHRIYIPPGQNQGFLYHLSELATYEAGQKELSKIESSKPMLEIMRQAGNNDPKIKKKRKRSGLTDEDYSETAMMLVGLPAKGSSEDWSSMMAKLGILKAGELAQDALKVRSCLLSRKFPETTDFIVLAMKGAESPSRVVGHLLGVFYKMTALEDESSCYQKAQVTEQGMPVCQDLYIFHRGTKWMIGSLRNANCVAFNIDGESAPTQLTKPWQVLRDDCPALSWSTTG